ncbi:helix-turn-helix transcriptional regulator [Brevundimonas olei]|uniref:Helix-turn-helix transcriptional regulator n=1 Tax=Brevundimonas olei TaxID=657642 RepID=A0ABZ2I890_9CAUL
MAKKTRDSAEYDILRERSGWYAAAWRDYRNLSLQDLADELGTSRSYLSDMETGAVDRNGKMKRFNRDWLDRFSKALDVRAGDLIDTNPFDQDPRFTAIKAAYPMLDETDREALASMVETLRRRHG